MKFSTAIVALSIAVNIALAVRWKQTHDSGKLAPGAQPAASPASTVPRPQIASPGPRDTAAPSKPPREGANPLAGAWSRLQSESLKEYVARLRAAGCPEETVQDIIIAEVGRLFAARRRALIPAPSESTWWKYQDFDTEAGRERSRKYKELAAEESTMLIDLLGVDPTKTRRNQDGYVDYRDSQLAFLPEERREAARKVIEQYDEKRQELYRRNGRIYDAQARNEQHALEQEQSNALALVLSPDELQQWKLRNSQIASQLQYDLSSLSINEDTYKKIFAVREKYGDSIYNYGGVSPEERDAATKAKDQMQKELQAALGPDLAKEYERSQDYSYKQVVTLAKRYDLPADTAGKVYDVKAAAEDAAKKINTDQSLSTEERQTALKAIRDETENTVKAQMGDKVYKSYQNSGGYWINNLSPRRVVRPPQAGQ